MAETTSSAGMGSEGQVVLNGEMQTAKAKFAAYRGTISGLVSELTDLVERIVNDGFSGQAGNGFKDFYTNNIQKFFEAGETFDKYIGSFDAEATGMLDQIEKALINEGGLDPSLGENNRNVGSQQVPGQA